MGSHEVNANVEFGANAIFSFRQFTSNALTPRGGNAKSKRETFCTMQHSFRLARGKQQGRGKGSLLALLEWCQERAF